MTKQKTPSLRAAIAVAVFTAAAVCTTATTARADTIVFNNVPGGGSQQNYVLGMDFDVLGLIEVTRLGAFDSDFDGFDGDVNVGIYDIAGNLLVSAMLTGLGTSNDGASRFVSITPYQLSAGRYSIVAAGFTGGNWSGNSQTAGEQATFNTVNNRLALVAGGGRWDNGNTLVFPTAGPYGQPDPVFQAGTFAANAVPDGGSAAALLGLGLLAVGWARRRLQ